MEGILGTIAGCCSPWGDGGDGEVSEGRRRKRQQQRPFFLEHCAHQALVSIHDSFHSVRSHRPWTLY